jgi:hypothetical protein
VYARLFGVEDIAFEPENFRESILQSQEDIKRGLKKRSEASSVVGDEVGERIVLTTGSVPKDLGKRLNILPITSVIPISKGNFIHTIEQDEATFLRQLRPLTGRVGTQGASNGGSLRIRR